MTLGTSNYLSDTFTLASRTLTGVGFNCPDSFLFYWRKLPGVNDYRLYTLGNTYLESISVTSDSQVVISKYADPTVFYAVAPIISGKEGMRSYTFDYTRQGVECYIRSFLGLLESNNVARLDLSLGTLYGIKSVVLEKQIGGRFIALKFKINSLLLTFLMHCYKVKYLPGKTGIIRKEVIYSLVETVYNLSDSRFIMYPNPVRQFQQLEILTSNDILKEVGLLVYDSFGRIIMQRTLKNFSEQIPTSQFSAGVYFFRFIVEGENDTIMKLLVQ
jgi:hypothetical protein